MMKKFLTEFNNIDTKVIKYINKGGEISFCICLLGVLFLILHRNFGYTYDIYKAGIILVRTGLIFVAQCICCGFISDKLMKKII